MPSEFTLYHNPRCSKSRAALALLEEKGVAADVVKYLDTAPDLATLQDMFAKLGIESVRGMMRTKDDLYKELGLIILIWTMPPYFRQSPNTLPCSSVPFW